MDAIHGDRSLQYVTVFSTPIQGDVHNLNNGLCIRHRNAVWSTSPSSIQVSLPHGIFVCCLTVFKAFSPLLAHLIHHSLVHLLPQTTSLSLPAESLLSSFWLTLQLF
ncbi:hypothetical protein K443DRAFT_245617 [Laccaria amethystina LaAM-08-1]|uniref:Uncharacterized protein n=1 Tax=Laccaria amethystina LaAM-08-1 TaxID=1095629 RepID=A0A0C9XYB7_9AGAR|nr:hypothetical protein K443DRAFT_245617 [Laccaria amethystina LaAM-08-1]